MGTFNIVRKYAPTHHITGQTPDLIVQMALDECRSDDQIKRLEEQVELLGKMLGRLMENTPPEQVLSVVGLDWYWEVDHG